MRRFLLICCFWVPTVFGGLSAGSGAWSEISEDETRILVMLPLDARNDRVEKLQQKLPDGSTITLRETFPVSGVYDLNTRQPLWTFDWGSSFKSDMVWNENFSAMVIWNYEKFIYKKDAAIGLNFLKEGKVQKFYSQDDLYTAFSRDIFLWGWDTYDDLSIDGEVVTYVTQERTSPSPVGQRKIGYWETYTFDMNTGEILSLEIENTKTKRIIAVIFACFVLVFGSIIGMLIWFLKRAELKREVLVEDNR